MGKDCCGPEAPKTPQAVLQAAAGGLLAIATYLRSAESKLKLRQGTMDGRRVDYFKGKHAVNALLRETYKKNPKRPTIETREAAEEQVTELLKQGFFIRADKTPKSKSLTFQQHQVFSPDAYYVWVYEVHQWWAGLAGFGILGVIFAGVLFPLWPAFMRQGVYYLSLVALGLIGVFFGIAIVRLIIWVGLKVGTGRGGWLFPNLFADVGVIESFIPTWEWDQPKGAKGSYSKVETEDAAGEADDE
ncbi:UNVERIFIED_CONTAM: Translocation protein S62 [Siphonaria sp. JEL0065]|nr:Translocation protein S62 [Siphonaria sp. JEL0065]